jgi:hypothetical protein
MNNQSVLQETKNIQQSTLYALQRTRRCVDESKEVGTKTLIELDEQDIRLSKTKKDTIELIDTLKKTDKAQNKFAFLSGHWGNRSKAKKELKREDNDDDAPIIIIKKTLFNKRRSGPSSRLTKNNKKEPNINNDNNNWTDNSSSENYDNGNNNSSTSTTSTSTAALKNVIEESKQTSEDVNTEVNRNELFDKARSKPKTRNKKERKGTKAAAPKQEEAAPLSDNDNNELNDINNIDKIIDDEIDLLGDQVNDLLQLSKTIGNKSNTQTTTLNTINQNLEDTTTRTKQINKRLKLFTTTRRERNKKEKEFKKNMNELLPTGSTKATVKMAVSGV